MDIEGWLQSLGLARYAGQFHANDIGLDMVSALTDADLATLGVSLGDRRRLLRAAATVRPPELEPAARSGAERRQLTVMFVDLVGSTALSTRLDPEELHEVIHAYQRTVAAEIARFEGHVAKYMGDGVLAYFGWPRAQEDAAERAVRAGLAATAAVAALALTPAGRLAARAGIATGLVVVGDLIGEGAAKEEAVVGQTPNLAARLQSCAEPGTVVVAPATRRLLGGLFTFTDLGARQLAGFSEPIAAFRVAGATASGSRFEALRGRPLTPLFGREHELDLLLDRWRRAREGAGQAVLLVGDAGIGKSRLVQDLRERISAEAPTRLHYFCSPYHRNTAFHPILAQIEHAAGLDGGDTAPVKLNKLETLFGRGEAAAMTAALLGIATDGRYEPSTLGPQGRKARLLEHWVQRLIAISVQRPVLMLLEDVHWIDPTSLELFDLIIERIQRLPVLLVATARPEFPSAWDRHSNVTTVALDRLDATQSMALITRVGGDRLLPGPVLDRIVASADGVPLFLEELTKAVLESGLLDDEAGRSNLPPLAIPTTLQDSLLARLDRLAPVKEVAQIAAAIGREFPHELLAAVARLDEPTLDQALTRLADAGLVFHRGMPADRVYAFKHALVRDAAYASLLRGPRQLIHARIAAALYERSTDCPPELMAHHLTEAGETDRSVDFWTQAGREAVSRAASREAVAHLRQALTQLLSLPDTVQRSSREAELQSALGAALVHVTGPASVPLMAAHARACDLYREAGDTKSEFVAEWNLWHVHYARADYTQAEALAGHLIAVAAREQDADLALQACHVEWVGLGGTADYHAALASAERGWTLYDPDRHGAHAFTFGAHDPGVCSRNHGAAANWALGRPDRARACHKQALALARRLGHPLILVNALGRGLWLLYLLRDGDRLAARATATIALATEQGFPNYRIDAEILRAWALRRSTNPKSTIRLIESGLQERQRLNSMWLQPYFLSMLASAQARGGDIDEARLTIDRALEDARRSGEVWHVPDLLRVRGELQLKANDLEAAEESLVAAMALAQSTQARALELRAATSLASLWSTQGRRAAAERLLTPIYQAFDEGLDTPDLKDAHTLLAALGSA